MTRKALAMKCWAERAEVTDDCPAHLDGGGQNVTLDEHRQQLPDDQK